MTDFMKQTLRKVQDLQRDADYNRIKRFEITCTGLFFVVDITNSNDENSSTIFDVLDLESVGSNTVQYHIDQIRVATRSLYTKDDILGMTVEEFIKVKNVCWPDADCIVYENNADNLGFVSDGSRELADMLFRGNFNAVNEYFIVLEDLGEIHSFDTVRDLFENGILSMGKILQIFNNR